LIDEHIVKDSHILKLNILGCDRTTPLKQNLVPRFAWASDKDESQGKKISSRRRQDNKVGIEKRENLDLDLHLLSAGLSRRRYERFTGAGDWKGR
jgi:hypothetical protein